ncbi:carbohydrate esterase family 1 protein, partial [Baudoinia panamericana UAMH 10762]
YSIVTTDGHTRYYSVQVPNPYDRKNPYPLIFDYHGASDTSTIQRNNSAYFNYTQDYLVVYPQGWGRHWQGPAYAHKGVNDTLFTSDLLAHIEDNYCIDPSRVYASGKSNGGGFVDTLACSSAGDAFAAFAMASAALYTDLNKSSCARRRPILESHGLMDTVINYTGSAKGNGGPLPNIDSWVSWWGERDCGPNATPHYDTQPRGYNVTAYSCGDLTDVVKHYEVFDLGHC